MVCSGRDATALAAAKGLAGRGCAAPQHRRAGAAAGRPSRAPMCGRRSARHRAALDALADLHRGETVLVVTDASVLTALCAAAAEP